MTVSALLWSSGAETMGVAVFSLEQGGESAAAAALAVIGTAVTILLALSTLLFGAPFRRESCRGATDADELSKDFGASRAVDDVSLTVEDGEFMAILGPSGCGKTTTLLRLVAGFETASGGEITVGDSLLSGPGRHVPPEHRRMGIVFQSYALWPHMSVAGNVAYALKVRGMPSGEREKRVAAALATVGLSGYADRRPASLSGGQRQRVALARCLAMEPSLVLLDEPLSNLDAHLRAAMHAEFAAFHQRARTHDDLHHP